MTSSFGRSTCRFMLLGLLLSVIQALAGCAVGSGEQRIPAGLALSVGTPLAADGYPQWLVVPTDPVVEAGLEGAGEWEGAILDWSWHDPDGTVVQRERRKLFGPVDRAFLALDDSNVNSRLGWWTMQVRGPGGAVAEKRFILVADKDRWWAMYADYGHERARALSSLCLRGDFSFLISRYSFDMPPEERQVLEICFAEHRDALVPFLVSALSTSPENEIILALAYKIKRQLIQRYKVSDSPDVLLRQLALLSTRWDAGLFASLLAVPSQAVKIGGIDLIRRTGADEAVLFLEQGLNDGDVLVRLKAVEALGKISGPVAEAMLRRRLPLERDPQLRNRLLDILDLSKGVPK